MKFPRRVLIAGLLTLLIQGTGWAQDELSAASLDPTGWTEPPSVQISQWGEELRIEVQPAPSMDPEKAQGISGVELQNEQGEILGIKSFELQEAGRSAEFMMDLKALQLEKIKIVVHHIAWEDWSVVMPLKVTAPPASGEPAAAPSPASPGPDQPENPPAAEAQV